MQPEFTHRCRDVPGELCYSLFTGRVRQYDQCLSLDSRDDVTRTPQATPYRLTNTPHAGVGGMLAEDVNVGRMIIQGEQHDR